MRFRRLRHALPHGPTSAGGLADLGLAVPEDSAQSRRREAIALYTIPLALLGVVGTFELADGPNLQEQQMLFVLGALALAGTVAAWMKRWQAGLTWRGAIPVLLGVALLVAPWFTSRFHAHHYGRFRFSFDSVFWCLGLTFAAAILFTLGREIGQRVRPALLTLPLAFVFIAHTPHRRGYYDRHLLCEIGHALDDIVVFDAVVFGLCVAYALYVARISSTRLRPAG